MQVSVQRSLYLWFESKWRRYCKVLGALHFYLSSVRLLSTEAFPLTARTAIILKHGVGECCNGGAELSSHPQWVFWGHLRTRSRQLMWEHLYRILIMSSQRSRVIQLYKNLLHLGREYPQGYDYFRSRCHNAFMKNRDVKGEQVLNIKLKTKKCMQIDVP